MLDVCNPWRNTEDGIMNKQGLYFNLCKEPYTGLTPLFVNNLAGYFAISEFTIPAI